MHTERLTIRVFGDVQGVGFRWSAAREAEDCNLAGFAHNEPDGSVYVEAEGERERLERFLAWCKKGPFHGKVTRIEVLWGGAIKGFKKFVIE